MEYIKNIGRRLFSNDYRPVNDQRELSIEQPLDKHLSRNETLKPKKYKEGIFEVEKTEEPGWSIRAVIRTRGRVEEIENSSEVYNSEALMVKDRRVESSLLTIETNEGKGVAHFPRRLSQDEKEMLLRNRVSYEGRYDCYNEGGLGLLKSWHYTLDIEGTGQRLRLEENITV